MKKWFALLLALTMLLPLIGCSTVPAETTAVPSTTVLPTASSSASQDTGPIPMKPGDDRFSFFNQWAKNVGEYTLRIQYLPETVDNPQGLPVLKWVYLEAYYNKTYRDTAMQEINQMLADKNMPFRLQMVIVGGEGLSLNPDMLSLPEVQPLLKEADLITANMTPEYRQKYLSPITEHITGDAQPSLSSFVPRQMTWATSTHGGEIYGITNGGTPYQSGWRVSTAFMQEYGLTKADFQKNYWEMDELFAKIYAANGGKPFLYANHDPIGRANSRFYSGAAGPIRVLKKIPGDLYLPASFQTVGAVYGIDLSGDTPTVKSLFEDSQVALCQDATIRYKEAGYTNHESTKCDVVFTEIVYDAGDTDINTCIVVSERAVDWGEHSRAANTTGVLTGSARKAEAISLLGLLAEDQAFLIYLAFGKEGRDYTMEHGYPDEITVNGQPCFLMNLPFAYSAVCGRYENYGQWVDDADYHWYPISFDFSDLEPELEAVGRIVEAYQYTLVSTQDRILDTGKEKMYTVRRMDAEGRAQMIAELQEAGSDKIVAALQAQLDAWLKENPDWPAKAG